MKIRLKRFLNNYKNKIVSFIAVFIAIPLFSFNAFAYTTNYPIYPYNLKRMYVSYIKGNTVSSTSAVTAGDHNIYYHSASYSGIDGLSYILYSGSEETDRWFSFPVNNDLYDYYICGSLISNLPQYNINISNIRLCADSDLSFYYTLKDLNITSVDYLNSSTGSSFTALIDSDDLRDVSSIYSVDLMFSSPFSASSSTYYFEFCVLYVPKDSSEEQVNNIVGAINNQTDVLGGYIDKGNDSTGGIVTDNNSAIDNLDDVVSEYHATEQQFFDDFNSNQQAISSDIVGWSWGGLVNCANWVGVTLTDYYNNMGDFRQYIIYPLMLGIALFFLGRGSSIIGHLYRKPTTTFTHTESRSTMSNGVRHTNTVTTRNGGVFRK